MVRKLQAYWWMITGAKRFRVRVYNDEGIELGFSPLMTYHGAVNYGTVFGGDLVCDHNPAHNLKTK